MAKYVVIRCANCDYWDGTQGDDRAYCVLMSVYTGSNDGGCYQFNLKEDCDCYEFMERNDPDN